MLSGFEYFEASGSAIADGFFIPISDLPGIDASELASGEAVEAKESKVVLALLNRIYEVLSAASASSLGFSIVKSVPTGGGSADLVNLSFSANWQRLIDLSSGLVSPIPLPTSGANSGIGAISAVDDLFPGGVKVSAGGVVSDAGVLIDSATLEKYTPEAHGTMSLVSGGDDREWLFALIDAIGTESVLRSATQASGIVGRVRGVVGSQAVPSAWYSSTDPVADLTEADLPKIGVITRNITLAVQVKLNQLTQAFDVNVVTA